MERHNLKSYEPNEIFINGKAIPDDRIVACVTALAGIDDPEAFMRDVRQAANPDWRDGFVPHWAINISKHLKGGAE